MVGLDVLDSPLTTVVGSIVDRDSVRRARGRRRRGRALGHAPQAARRLARSRGVRRDEHHRHAEPARGGGRGGRRPVRLHEHHQRVRPGAGARGRCAGGVDHRGRRAGPPQHLRRDQDRRRGSVRADLARPSAAVPDPADVAVLPRARRPRRRPQRLRRPEPQGQRAAVPPRRPRGRGQRPPCSRSSGRRRSASAAT